LKEIVLASSSPRRREILEDMGLDFSVVTASVNEKIDIDDPEILVKKLAFRKARNVFSKIKSCRDFLVIGADTVIYYQGNIIGKPLHKRDAESIISALSGKSHTVMTGLAVITNGEEYIDCDQTLVRFRSLSLDEIRAYINTEEYTDKAGGYAIQGKGSILIEKIEGSYTNVVGMPTALLIKMLKRADMDIEKKLFKSHNNNAFG